MLDTGTMLKWEKKRKKDNNIYSNIILSKNTMF